jgi:hypothetical protein
MSTFLEESTGGKTRPDRVDLDLMSKSGLQDSEMTQPTDGSVSDDEAGGWWGAIGTDFRNLATCFTDTIPPVMGGVAFFIHKTAASVAAEFAQLERDGELEAERWREENERSSEKDSKSLSLPWEIRQDFDHAAIPVYIANNALKADILALSLDENTFLEPFSPPTSDSMAALAKSSFVLDEPRITLIRRLLDIDENLAAMQAHLSGEFFAFASSSICMQRRSYSEWVYSSIGALQDESM